MPAPTRNSCYEFGESRNPRAIADASVSNAAGLTVGRTVELVPAELFAEIAQPRESAASSAEVGRDHCDRVRRRLFFVGHAVDTRDVWALPLPRGARTY